MSGGNCSRTMYIYHRNFNIKHLMTSFRNVLPGIELFKEEYNTLASFFHKEEYLQKAFAEIKKLVETEEASKHFMVALTMATLFKQKHEDLTEAQDYIWHCDRYKNLIALLRTLYDKIKTKERKGRAFVFESIDGKTYMKFNSTERSLMKDINTNIIDNTGLE